MNTCTLTYNSLYPDRISCVGVGKKGKRSGYETTLTAGEMNQLESFLLGES